MDLSYQCVWNVLSLHDPVIAVMKSIIPVVSIDAHTVMPGVGYVEHPEKPVKFVIDIHSKRLNKFFFFQHARNVIRKGL